jgi:type VI protein secretion system component VasK
MREGAALDAELAEAIGVSVEDLPEGKVWERDRAYFLRDLFVEKVFREKSLVTRASNTKQMLRSQQIALFSVALVSLTLFSAFAWFARRDVNDSVAGHAKWWQPVSSRTGTPIIGNTPSCREAPVGTLHVGDPD